jgi:hypothetical protein
VTTPNSEFKSSEQYNDLGEAAGDMVGHLGTNAARLVGGVMSDAAQVSRRWHELSLTVALTYWKTAAKAVEGSVKRINQELGTRNQE